MEDCTYDSIMKHVNNATTSLSHQYYVDKGKLKVLEIVCDMVINLAEELGDCNLSFMLVDHGVSLRIACDYFAMDREQDSIYYSSLFPAVDAIRFHQEENDRICVEFIIKELWVKKAE